MLRSRFVPKSKFTRTLARTLYRALRHHEPMANPADTPEIQQAYDNVRSDKSNKDWLVINYEDAKSDKLCLKASGSGGLEELKKHLDANEAQYA